MQDIFHNPTANGLRKQIFVQGNKKEKKKTQYLSHIQSKWRAGLWEGESTGNTD
jgi:hypothetical protein